MNRELKGGTRFKNAQEKPRLNKLKCSIVTVVFNGGDSIEDAIRSVLEQTYDNIEYIIIDGGSTDETLNIIRKHEEHIDYWVSEKDAGIYDAMNKGIAIATGEVVGFLNSDDMFALPSAVAKIAAVFEDRSIDACYADLMYVSQDNRTIVRYWKSSQFVMGSFGLGWNPPHPTFYVRSRVFKRFGGFDLSIKIASDVDLMMRYLERYKIRAVYISQALIRMRVGGVSNKSLKSILRQNKEVINALKKNGVRFSLIKFAARKIVNRAWQYVVGHI
ncbi:glycosyltransferase [Polynucleobacter sp. MWH-HuK1]|nr:glycosyltransferase [Polynucleobacter sp. MWH-HuK1]